MAGKNVIYEIKQSILLLSPAWFWLLSPSPPLPAGSLRPQQGIFNGSWGVLSLEFDLPSASRRIAIGIDLLSDGLFSAGRPWRRDSSRG